MLLLFSQHYCNCQQNGYYAESRKNPEFRTKDPTLLENNNSKQHQKSEFTESLLKLDQQ